MNSLNNENKNLEKFCHASKLRSWKFRDFNHYLPQMKLYGSKSAARELEDGQLWDCNLMGTPPPENTYKENSLQFPIDLTQDTEPWTEEMAVRTTHSKNIFFFFLTL